MRTNTVMKNFLEPGTVAVVGASRRGLKEESFNPLEYMVQFGYQGKIYPINPNADELFGLKSYPKLEDVPGEVDLAVITLPRNSLPQAVKECVEKDIKSIIIYTQGLADADEQGESIQSKIVEIARAGGARILGPNTLGVINVFNNFHTVFAHVEGGRKLPLAVVSQSGIFMVRSFLKWVQVGQAPLGKLVDLGNACDIDHADVLEYLEDDPDIKVIVLYIEGIKNGRRFLEVARRVTKKKTILALKMGRSEQAARVVASHTGSLAGRDEVYDAVFRQCGIIRAEDLDEMDGLTQAFLNLPPMRGKRVAMFSHMGSVCSMGTDACGKHGLEMAELSPETVERLCGFFPQWMPVRNPIDFWLAAMGHGYKRVYQQIFEALLEDKNVDAVACLAPAFPEYYDSLNPIEIIKQTTARFNKPVLVFVYGPLWMQRKVELEESNRVLACTSLDEAMKALAALWRYSQLNGQVSKVVEIDDAGG